MALQAGQYVARNVDNTPKNPQPGDVEITDAFGNVFDNFNEYGTNPGQVRFYDVENNLVSPQPQYQNLGYVQYTVENTPVSPAWEPDAGQWIARGVDNQVRTPQPYAKSPLFPDGPPSYYVNLGRRRTVSPAVRLEQNEALIVTEDDINTITLVVTQSDYPSIEDFG